MLLLLNDLRFGRGDKLDFVSISNVLDNQRIVFLGVKNDTEPPGFRVIFLARKTVYKLIL
jgi:hypothetical protein